MPNQPKHRKTKLNTNIQNQIAMKTNTIIDTWQNRLNRIQELKPMITDENKRIQAIYLINQLQNRIQNRYKAQT